MEEKKEPNFHDEAVLITSFLKSEGGQAFINRIERQKKHLELKVQRSESDIEVSAVEKKGDNITIVVLNKDENKIKLGLQNALLGEFELLKNEAAKPAGGTE